MQPNSYNCTPENNDWSKDQIDIEAENIEYIRYWSTLTDVLKIVTGNIQLLF